MGGKASPRAREFFRGGRLSSFPLGEVAGAIEFKSA